MIRLMLMLFAFLWSALLETNPGGGGDDAPEKVELTTDELTQRTSKAAEDKVSELAGVLGVDLSSPADVKALIEAGRKAGETPTDDKPDDKPREAKPGEDTNIKDIIDAALKPFTDRLGQIEQTEQQRQTAAAEQTRSEKIQGALKGANVKDEHLENAARYASTFELSVNDKGELTGSKEAIDAVKKAMPHAFRGEGDTGDAADTSGREKTDRKPKDLSEALTAHYSKS